jgi:DNA-binding response OmpR family regulator
MTDVADSAILVAGAVSLDLRRYVVHIGGASWPISKREAKLLRFFMEREGQVVLREELQRTLWGETKVSSRAIETTLTRLRRALRERAVGRVIRTVHSTGYQFIGAPETFRVKGAARPTLKPRIKQATYETAHPHR